MNAIIPIFVYSLCMCGFFLIGVAVGIRRGRNRELAVKIDILKWMKVKVEKSRECDSTEVKDAVSKLFCELYELV